MKASNFSFYFDHDQLWWVEANNIIFSKKNRFKLPYFQYSVITKVNQNKGKSTYLYKKIPKLKEIVEYPKIVPKDLLYPIS